MGRKSQILAKEGLEQWKVFLNPTKGRKLETLEGETAHQEGDILPLWSHSLPPFGPEFLSVRAPEIRIPLHDAKVHVDSRAGLDEDWRFTGGAATPGKDGVSCADTGAH